MQCPHQFPARFRLCRGNIGIEFQRGSACGRCNWSIMDTQTASTPTSFTQSTAHGNAACENDDCGNAAGDRGNARQVLPHSDARQKGGWVSMSTLSCRRVFALLLSPPSSSSSYHFLLLYRGSSLTFYFLLLRARGCCSLYFHLPCAHPLTPKSV